MAVKNREVLKEYFLSGKVPNSKEFWDLIDSFRHRTEKIPGIDIEGWEYLAAGDFPVLKTTDPAEFTADVNTVLPSDGAGEYIHFLGSDDLPLSPSSEQFEEGRIEFRKLPDGTWKIEVIPMTLQKASELDETDEVNLQTGVTVATWANTNFFRLSPELIAKNSILYKKGIFFKTKVDLTPSYSSSGYIDYTNGNVVGGVGSPYRYSNYIDIESYEAVNVYIHPHTSAGLAFYDSSNIFVGGFIKNDANIYLIPPAAKYYRATIHSTVTPIDSRFAYGTTIQEVKDDELYFIENNLPSLCNLFGVLSPKSVLRPNKICINPGAYAEELLKTVTVFNSAGFIDVTDGLLKANVNYKATALEAIPEGANMVIIHFTPLDSPSAGAVFYDELSQPLLSDVITYPLNDFAAYYIPEEAAFFRASIHNTVTTNREIWFVDGLLLEENQLLFVDKNSNIKVYQGGGGTISEPTGTSIIEDLPISDGSDVTTGHAYVDSVTGHVIRKP